MSTHLFFDNIFRETHEELTDLQESLVVLDTENESSEESNQETEILSKKQIKDLKILIINTPYFCGNFRNDLQNPSFWAKILFVDFLIT